MNETEYDQARQSLMAEIEEKKKDLEALERIRSRGILPAMGRSEPVPKPESNGRHIGNNEGGNQTGMGKGELLKAVKEWVGRRKGATFTAPQLISGLNQGGIDAKTGSTKSVVSRLVEEGFLKIEVQGMGRRASVYKASEST